jgi:hypothetical protein
MDKIVRCEYPPERFNFGAAQRAIREGEAEREVARAAQVAAEARGYEVTVLEIRKRNPWRAASLMQG